MNVTEGKQAEGKQVEMESQVHIVLAGGGTAGHVNPLLSVGDAIRTMDPTASVSVIGTAQGLESDLVPRAGYEMDVIEKVPFPRRPDASMMSFPARWHHEVARVRDILSRRGADVVVGFGGYASAPAYRAAHRMGIPMVVHEQNARAGMANRLGARWADVVATAFDETGLKARPGARLVRVGLPLRPAIARLIDSRERDARVSRRDCAQALGLDPDRPIIVVTGGSLGALSLNAAVSSAARELLRHTQVVHLTGRGKDVEVRDMVAQKAGADVINDLGPTHAGMGDYHIAPYLERIDLAFGCADLVICRSGAGSVCELSALGVPAVYVPLPVGNGEQRFNAAPVVDAGGGVLVDDHDFTTLWVARNVPAMLADTDALAKAGHQAWSYGIRDAAQTMASIVLGLVD